MKYLVYILFVLICVGCVCGELFVKNKRIKFVFFVIPLASFFLLAILRADSVGIDTHGYRESYVLVRQSSLPTVIKKEFPEIGFYFFQYVFSGLLKLPAIIFDVFNYSLVVLFLFLAFCKEKHKTMYVVIFLFAGFFCMSFSGIRQAIAISIATLAFTFYFRRDNYNPILKTMIYYLLVLFAISFHKSAAILVIVPIVVLIDFEQYQIPFIPLFIVLFLPLLLGRSFVLSGLFVKKLVDYTRIFDSRISVTMIFEVVFVVLFYALFFTPPGGKIRSKLSISDFKFRKRDSDYLWLIIIGCILMAFNTSSTIITRLSMFFYTGITYYLTKISDTFSKNWMRRTYRIIMTIGMGLYFIYSTPTLGLTPYAIR